MLKSALYALLLLPFLFSACNKESSPTAREFIITGVNNFTLDPVLGTALPIAVQATTAASEPVTISVTGLPAGVSVDIQPNNGTPAFNSTLTFTRTAPIAPGAYPIKVTGQSASFTKEYDITLTVPGNTFDINGVQDITMNGFSTNFSVGVVSTAGASDPVTLSITGLPAGIASNIQPASGTPAFTSIITFTNMAATITPGTYPIKLTGTSATHTRSYDFNLIIPTPSSYTLNGGLNYTNSLVRSFNSPFSYLTATPYVVKNGITSVTASIMGTWPTATGTYNYPLSNIPNGTTMVISYDMNGSTFKSTANGAVATVTVAPGGKLSLKVTGASTTNGTVTNAFSIDARE